MMKIPLENSNFMKLKNMYCFFLQAKHTFEHGKRCQMYSMCFHACFFCLMGSLVGLNYIKYYKKGNYLGHL